MHLPGLPKKIGKVAQGVKLHGCKSVSTFTKPSRRKHFYGKWNCRKQTLTQTCAGQRLWDFQLVFCSWLDFYWINQTQWMSQTQKNGQFQCKQTSSVCFKVARGKLWEMFGDLNLGDFKCKVFCFHVRRTVFFMGWFQIYIYIYISFDFSSEQHCAHCTCCCHQWSNRPHNKFTHDENNSFSSFTSVRLQTWAVHVAFQLKIDELLNGTKQKSKRTIQPST